MALVKSSSIQKHPLLWGLLWAAATIAIVSGIKLLVGERFPNPVVILPIWAVAGACWGYAMKWVIQRREQCQ